MTEAERAILLRELHKIWPPLDEKRRWAVKDGTHTDYAVNDAIMLSLVDAYLAVVGPPVSVTQVVID